MSWLFAVHAGLAMCAFGYVYWQTGDWVLLLGPPAIAGQVWMRWRGALRWWAAG
jgi:hypothetical protein